MALNCTVFGDSHQGDVAMRIRAGGVVEFHGFHNEATPSRMHIEISRQQSERWYAYWMEQFNQIWSAAADRHRQEMTRHEAFHLHRLLRL
jgi:hypothetical protein